MINKFKLERNILLTRWSKFGFQEDQVDVLSVCFACLDVCQMICGQLVSFSPHLNDDSFASISASNLASAEGRKGEILDTGSVCLSLIILITIRLINNMNVMWPQVFFCCLSHLFVFSSVVDGSTPSSILSSFLFLMCVSIWWQVKT